MTTLPTFEALGAAGPAPELAEQLMLYGQFVGEWNFDWTGFDADGNETLTAKGEWLFTWILEGRAVQDVWICPSRELRSLPDTPQGEHGTTVRMFDPEIEMWRVVWFGPGFNNLRSFVAYARNGEIVQEGRTPGGEPLHWIFFDIGHDSFEWRSQILHGGRWRPSERMSVRRRSA